MLSSGLATRRSLKHLISRVWCASKSFVVISIFVASITRRELCHRSVEELLVKSPVLLLRPLYPICEAMANEGFKLSKGSTSNVSTGAFFKSRDDYRKHPILTGHLKRATPGLGIALGLFGVYLIVDGVSSKFSTSKDHH